jgi:hypothetical protein
VDLSTRGCGETSGVRRPCAGWVAVTCCALAVAARPVRADENDSEAALKAEFVERFTRFIDWPRDVLPASAPFRLCVTGNSPVAGALAHLARTRRFKRHVTAYQQLVALDGVTGCHLLFIAGSERRRLEHILARTQGRPVLTIGDTDGYAARGVIINLYRTEDRLRFEINVAAALESGLRFRSKLLKLARLTGVDDGAHR